MTSIIAGALLSIPGRNLTSIHFTMLFDFKQPLSFITLMNLYTALFFKQPLASNHNINIPVSNLTSIHFTMAANLPVSHWLPSIVLQCRTVNNEYFQNRLVRISPNTKWRFHLQSKMREKQQIFIFMKQIFNITASKNKQNSQLFIKILEMNLLSID